MRTVNAFTREPGTLKSLFFLLFFFILQYILYAVHKNLTFKMWLVINNIVPISWFDFFDGHFRSSTIFDPPLSVELSLLFSLRIWLAIMQVRWMRYQSSFALRIIEELIL
jgi:hypothetical protein